MTITLKKKLIEVALPLEKINAASAREKSIRHGHPSTLHLWWARRPLAAARAVIFAQMVDDPSARPELFPTEETQEAERQRLFRLLEQLVLWENTTNERLLAEAREEIWKSWRRTCADNANHPRASELFNPDKLPGFHDPFAGGGALPLEAQRLGLESYASDLNPVAVLINKAMIEIPPRFANRPPVNPDASKGQLALGQQWRGVQGLAEDVRYYGKWMRDEAQQRIGDLYPEVEVTAEMASQRPDLKSYVGQKLTVIAWLWARTVKSPNPAFAHVDVPLVSSFMLANKEGKEAYVQPVIEEDAYHFIVKVGKPQDVSRVKTGTKLARGANFQCIMSGTPITGDYIKAEGHARRLGARLMAIVVEGERGRVFLSPTPAHEQIAASAQPTWAPDQEIYYDPHSGSTFCVLYGLKTFGDLFTSRQLVALTTFSDLVMEVRERVLQDALTSGLSDDGLGLDAGGSCAAAYAEAVSVYLAFAVDRVADRHTSIATWDSSPSKLQLRNTFARQAIPMTWDFGEGNPFCMSSGTWLPSVEWVAESVEFLPVTIGGYSHHADASKQALSTGRLISSDPPYYDNIGYADLSDFFYVWLRRCLRPIFPHLFGTLAVPKAEELVATPSRHGGKEQAETFFLDGMTLAMQRLAEQSHPAFPVTIYYAFKQSETNSADGTSSTGWETFLGAVIQAGFGISGTWPMRTELGNRMVGSGTNALASSIVLVCRPRPESAPTVTRRDFVAALKAELPTALRLLQGLRPSLGETSATASLEAPVTYAGIAPVDLAQAAIGPGMAIFTRYGKVLNANGQPLTVREALALINETLDEVLAEQEGDFDADTRWALAWFDQHGFSEGEYGVAETLSKAKNTSVGGMVGAGLLASKGGKVRLLRPEELPADWDPAADNRLTAWETVHHLVRVLNTGEQGAAQLLARLGPNADIARELAYRLYAVCERKKRAAEALAYNALVQSWPELVNLAREQRMDDVVQSSLFGEE